MVDTRKNKPKKPYADFPLFPHATGRWAKKIRGRFHYFGPWDDPDAALKKYIEQRDHLHTGLTPPVTPGALVVRDICNQFLNAKSRMVASGEMRPGTFHDYKGVCGRMVKVFGRDRAVADLKPNDFGLFRAKLSKSFIAPTGLAKQIQVCRSVFHYGHKAGLLEHPMRFGTDFDKPGRKAVRRARHSGPVRLFEPVEIHNLMAKSSTQLRAMMLLAINAGLGNTDLAELPESAIDLDAGMLVYPRPKTAVERRSPLWPETVEAIHAAIKTRPDAKHAADKGLVFITKYGRRWVRRSGVGNLIDSISREFQKVRIAADIRKDRVGFYALRHTFRTVADEVRDRPAIDLIMGHTDESMAGHYRERISNDRLKAVVSRVHDWLYV